MMEMLKYTSLKFDKYLGDIRIISLEFSFCCICCEAPHQRTSSSSHCSSSASSRAAINLCCPPTHNPANFSKRDAIGSSFLYPDKILQC